MILQVDIFEMFLMPFRLMYVAVKIPLVALSYLIVGTRKTVQAGKIVKGHLSRDLKCPQGHLQPADAVWECNCGFKRGGFVWKACPACHLQPSHVDCKECGLSIVNPAA